jgi:hypothetical protein
LDGAVNLLFVAAHAGAGEHLLNSYPILMDLWVLDAAGRSRRGRSPLAPAGVRCGFPGGPPTPRLKGPSAGSDRGACQPWEIPRSQAPEVARGDIPTGTFVPQG